MPTGFKKEFNFLNILKERKEFCCDGTPVQDPKLGQHHCRQCGRLFCNNCAQQRMKLRGQGDYSLVRLCGQCKTTEEVKLICSERHLGHKTRKAKDGSKVEGKDEDTLVQNILEAVLHPSNSNSSLEDLLGPRRGMEEASVNQMVDGATPSSSDVSSCNVMKEVSSNSPEELRRLAQEEKQMHKTLKSRGKHAEALAAFKRGRALEREAAALERLLRKSSRVASTSKTSKIAEDGGGVRVEKARNSSRSSKLEKDAIASELKELGWSDADVHDADTKQGKQSLESELLSLIGGSHAEKKCRIMDKSNIIAHKKKALELKREGKLAEAKEELKQAKILERQLEELDFLPEARESDDELSALIHGMNDGGMFLEKTRNPARSIDKDDFASQLKELGWSDADTHDVASKPEKQNLESELFSLLGASHTEKKKNSGIDRSQVIAHKREALKLKREGKLVEAKEELKQAKILERQLEEKELLAGPEEPDDKLSALIHGMEDDDKDFSLDDASGFSLSLDFTRLGDDLPRNSNLDVSEDDMNDPEIAAALKSFGWNEEDAKLGEDIDPEKDHKRIAEEISSLKREAVMQRKAGNTAMALNTLKKAKQLEKDLECLDDGSQETKSASIQKTSISEFPKTLLPFNPTETEITSTHSNPKQQKNKSAIKRELLILKRKALALKREGHLQEAEDELRKATILELQLKEMENAPIPQGSTEEFDRTNLLSTYPDHYSYEAMFVDEVNGADVTEQDMVDPTLLSALKNLGWEEDFGSVNRTREASIKPARSKGEIQREVLAIKRKALALRRQGKPEEAEEELRKASDLDNQLKELEAKQGSSVTSNIIEHEDADLTNQDMKGNQGVDDSSSADMSVAQGGVTQASSIQVNKLVLNHDRFKMQQECLDKKHQVAKLRKEGKVNEAAALLEQAQDLQIQVEELDKSNATRSCSKSEDGTLVNLLDIELLSALKNGIEVESSDSATQPHRRTGVKMTGSTKDSKIFSDNPKRWWGKDEVTEEELRNAANLENRLGVQDDHQSYPHEKTSSFGCAGGLSLDNLIPKGETYENQLCGTGISLNLGSSYIGNSYPKNQRDQHADLLHMPRNADTACNDVALNATGLSEKTEFPVEQPVATYDLDYLVAHSKIPSDPVLGVPSNDCGSFIDILSGDSSRQTYCQGEAVVPQENVNLVDLLTSDWNGQHFQQYKPENTFPCYLTPQHPNVVETVPKKTIDRPLKQQFVQSMEDQLHGHSADVLSSHSQTEFLNKGSMGNDAIVGLGSLENQILAHKRRALALKRDGKLAEAREELKQAKILQMTLEADCKRANDDKERINNLVSVDSKRANEDTRLSDSSTSAVISVAQTRRATQASSIPVEKPMPNRDRFKMQQECLAKKRQAAKLRKEGKMKEATTLLEQAQDLQTQIEELDKSNASESSCKSDDDDAMVEKLLDPQLLSALKSVGIGVESPDHMTQSRRRTDRKTSESINDSKSVSMAERREKIIEQIKAEKLRAVNFKRCGKMAEALEALRTAKQHEKKLAYLDDETNR